MKEYIGVNFSIRFKKWAAKVTHNNTVYPCGLFDTPREAALARDKKIIEKNLPHKLQILKPVVK